MTVMRMAFVLFDGMTTMDFVGFYEGVSWVAILKAKENVSWTFCANKAEVSDDRGLTIKANEILPDLGAFDLVFLPGGHATRTLRNDEEFISWIRTAEGARYKVSVCTGALLLGAAGFLEGKKATTNSSAYDLLAPYCGEVIKARAVREGDTFTGGGVTSSIDLGLYLIECLVNTDTARQVQKRLEYPYYQAGNLSDIYYPYEDK